MDRENLLEHLLWGGMLGAIFGGLDGNSLGGALLGISVVFFAHFYNDWRNNGR